MLRPWMLRLGSVMLLATAISCGNGMEKLTGKITVGGEPPPPELGGAVSFFPQAGASAMAPLREDGTFEMTTGSQKGLKPGEYQVAIGTWFGNLPMTPSPTHPSWTHKKYAKRQTSGLTITVPVEGNHIEWDLDPDDGKPVR